MNLVLIFYIQMETLITSKGNVILNVFSYKSIFYILHKRVYLNPFRKRSQTVQTKYVFKADIFLRNFFFYLQEQFQLFDKPYVLIYRLDGCKRSLIPNASQ